MFIVHWTSNPVIAISIFQSFQSVSNRTRAGMKRMKCVACELRAKFGNPYVLDELTHTNSLNVYLLITNQVQRFEIGEEYNSVAFSLHWTSVPVTVRCLF